MTIFHLASPLLAAFGKRVKRYLHIECAAAQDSIPLYCLGNGGTTLEVEYPRATVPCWLLRYSQLSVLESQMLVRNTSEYSSGCCLSKLTGAHMGLVVPPATLVKQRN